MSLSNLPFSASCQAQLVPLLTSDLGNCLDVMKLVPLITGGSDSSIVSPVNDWLVDMCPKEPCTQQAIDDGKQKLQQGCSSDMQDPNSMISLVGMALNNYTVIRKAACEKNGDNYCVTETLTTIEQEGKTNITFNFVTSLLSGNQSAMGPVNTALESGKLCTQCVASILNDASAIAPDLLNGTIGNATTAKCGSDFFTKGANGTTTGNATTTGNSTTTGNGTAGTNGTTPTPSPTSGAEQLSIASGTIGVLAAGVLAFSAYVL